MTIPPMETRLIQCAIDLFGRDGVSAVSTRSIAKAAGAQMSAITYHFGGKEGLYLACARHIAAEMRERVTPLLELARNGFAESGDAAEAHATILTILSGFVTIMMNDDIAPIARFVVREQMNPSPAFEILFEDAVQPVIERMEELLRRIARHDLTRDQLRIRTVALMGQVLVLRFARATLMHATGWQSTGTAETGAVRAIVVAHTAAILSDLKKGADS